MVAARIAALAALTLLAACGSTSSTREPPPKPFTGTKWMLKLELTPPGIEAPFLQFGDGHVSGSTGCNRLNGRYQQDAVGAGMIVFTQVSTSKRACEPRLMSIESRMLEVMGTSTSVQVVADTMRIDGSAGKLDFVAEPPPTPPAK